MGTSTKGYYARFPEAQGDANDDVDTEIFRDIVDNLNHLGDQYAQTLVNWAPQSGKYMGIDATITPAIDTYYRLWRSGPFDLHVRVIDGEVRSYPLYCRLYITGNSGSFQAAFAAVVATEGQAEVERDIAGPNVDTFPITSASFAWVEPSDLLYLDAARVAQARRRIRTLNSVGGGEVDTVWLRAELTIFGQIESLSGGATPRVGGALLREFIEP